MPCRIALMPARGQQPVRLWAAWLPILLLAGLVATQEPRTEVGPAVCHPKCTDHGNCGEDGHCRCPFGRTGEACEIDFLRPCKQDPDGQPSCGRDATKSCECFQRCHEWECLLNSEGRQICHRPLSYLGDRACYERKGVPPDDQFSKVPEPEEEGVTCYTGFDRGTHVNCSVAMTDFNDVTLPLSQCPNQCNNRGYCMSYADRPKDSPPECRCYRGFVGNECEVEENSCFLSCSGRGKCTDQFCHCKPPYFSIGCTRSKVFPPNQSRPSPVNFKIYMYELSTQLAYDYAYQVGYVDHYFIYVAFQKFLSQFLVSAVRTEDPSEANLFFVPAFTFSYSSNVVSPQDHVALVVDHLRQTSPYWKRTEGRDHFLWLPGDRGACALQGMAHQPMKVLHFGYHTTRNNVGGIGHLGHPDYGCTNPLRDVVAVPHDVMDAEMVPWLAGTSVDDLVAGKKRMFFFAGGVRDDDPKYSGGTRQAMNKLVKKWKDPEFEFVEGWLEDYRERLRTSKFCFAPYGHGWGNRLLQGMLAGCVPILVQEHVMHPYDDLLPYETFSLRLSNDDLPKLREILAGVTEEQYRGLVEGVKRYTLAFSWNTGVGGRAFDYTIASLRRKYMNMKAMYY